ncbi:AtuA-related protein [Limnochorda pilosa]|uniref:AtuA-like ferredoxin-fold domain-containing protein n=1 Tax=Limnochorda pilosa TaxID=1555112 RepID=A0A0K2SPU6_LIMPI|nr:hypothetical protein [Limnochorda pilosa]BAS29032.1 hypothetical protein LIP_3215 [Limnochorda pilosa]
MKIRLAEIAQARSGDKGDASDISLFAPTPELYDLFRREVTPERVKAHFGSWCRGPVHRWEVPGMRALKFVLEQALGGGAPSSLRLDNLGKSMASALLRMELDVPQELLEGVPRLRPPRS